MFCDVICLYYDAAGCDQIGLYFTAARARESNRSPRRIRQSCAVCDVRVAYLIVVVLYIRYKFKVYSNHQRVVNCGVVFAIFSSVFFNL